MNMTFPKNIFVALESNGEDVYLVAESDLQELGVGRVDNEIGVYELKEARKMAVEYRLK